jgi:hypothetical protein
VGQQTPVTRYARNGPVHIAYQAVGTGPPDLVYGTHRLKGVPDAVAVYAVAGV